MKDFVCVGWFLNFFICAVNIFAYYAEVSDASLSGLILFHGIVFFGGIFYLLNLKEKKESDNNDYYL